MLTVASSQRPLWATMIATFFGIGRLRPGPGTWGSAATVLLWAAIGMHCPGLRTPSAIGLPLFVTLIGIPAATRVARASASERSSIRRHRRGRRTTHRADRCPARMENFSRRFYTF